MADDLLTTHRSYQAALAAMAVSPAGLRERLLDAYRKLGRSGSSQRGRDIPANLQQRMAALHERLTSAGPGPEGSIAKTINAMEDAEVQAAAAELVAIAQAIDQEQW